MNSSMSMSSVLPSGGGRSDLKGAAGEILAGSISDASSSKIFEATRISFLESLEDEEKASLAVYQDAESMLEDLGQLAKSHPAQEGKIKACCTKVKALASLLSPYFKVVDLLVQSNPEYACLAWGALRLIFTLGVNYISFLEKLCDLIGNMTVTLPAFEIFLDKFNKRQSQNTGIERRRIAAALAHIYRDLFEFFYRAYKMFRPAAKVLGPLRRLKIQATLAWRLFDIYFSDMIEKFEYHSKLFQLEMQVASNIEALEFYTSWEERMSREVRLSRESTAEDAENAVKNAICGQIQELQKRIQAPVWSSAFEHARDHWVPNTGDWLLRDPIFAKHIDFRHSNAQSNVLFIRAKPGYGKTTLAAHVIEYVKQAGNGPRDNDTPAVLFYFFDKQNPTLSRAYDAFRALLSQLVHMRRHDKKVLDIAAFARTEHDNGHSIAPNYEVHEILHLLLLHIGNCVLVCDGVDECTNPVDLLKGLNRLASDHEACHMILFGRPSIKLPFQFSNNCNFLDLDASRNVADLTSYVEHEVEELIDSGELVLPAEVSIGDAVGKLVSKADGMFLWAALFIEYLKLPSLTFSQRWNDIDDPVRFQGLHGLYDAIFGVLQKTYPSSARVSLRKTLQWVYGAMRPLRVDELQIAVAIKPKVVFDKNDMIPHFKHSLGPMSGALLEVTREQTVRFIHITLCDYLISASATTSPVREIFAYDFKPEVLHHYITMSCISYLHHSVPSHYMAGEDEGMMSTRDCHFQEYAAKFWIKHFAGFFHSMKEMKETMDDYSNERERLGASCIAFIQDKNKYTSWIEAIYRFGLNKNLRDLLDPIEKLRRSRDLFLGQLESSISVLPRHQYLELLEREDSLDKAFTLLHQVREEQAYINWMFESMPESLPEMVWHPRVSAMVPVEYLNYFRNWAPGSDVMDES